VSDDVLPSEARRRAAEGCWMIVLEALQAEQPDEADMERALRGEEPWRDQMESRVRRDMLNLRTGPADIYDPEFGEDRKCRCGYPYHRHFSDSNRGPACPRFTGQS